MTVKFAPILCVAALLLAACGTVEDETPQTSVVQPMPVQKRVVHGPIVPDGPVSRVSTRKRASTYASSNSSRRRAVATAPITAPAQVQPVETPKVETPAPAPTPPAPAPTTPAPTESAPVTTADATPPPAATTSPATTPEATTPPTETIVPPAAPVTSEPLPAPMETAPVETSTESSQPLLPGLDPGKLPELLQMTFAGLPLWLIGLVGLVLVVALAIGFGGRRQPEHEDSI